VGVARQLRATDPYLGICGRFQPVAINRQGARRGGIAGRRRRGGFIEIEMAKFSPFKFMQEVRAEAEKVTWPSRRETAITTAMVFVMVAIAAVFFLISDQVIRIVVTLVLGIGG
jgi:preprotein translocase subunit SecE